MEKCKICNKRNSPNICKKCIKNNNVYSINILKETFEISDSDIKTLPSYIGPNNIIFYSRDDVIKIISDIYKTKKSASIELKQKIRKKELFDKLKENKLEYKKNSICDAYIKFGSPNINEVVDILLKNQLDEINRFICLIDELNKRNINYDNRIPIFKKYIKNEIDIDETIKIAETEKFLIENTNYLSLLKIYDNNIARDLALQKYNNSINYCDIIDLKFD
jgi:hypothetical protein